MKRVSLFLIAAILAIGVAGCVGPRNGAPTQIQGIEDDQFSLQATINGGMVIVFDGNGYDHRWFIRTFVDKKTHAVTHQLYFDIEHDPPRSNFEFASDDSARPLPVTKIFAGRQCDHGCWEYEAVGIGIDEATLKSRLLTGYIVKVSARDGRAYVLDIAPTTIQMQFAALDKVIASLAR